MFNAIYNYLGDLDELMIGELTFEINHKGT